MHLYLRVSNHFIQYLTATGCIKNMAQQIKQMLLLFLVGFSLLYEVQSGVFVVYPFGMDQVNPKFLSRKLDSGDSLERNSFNKTHLHLIYPVNEDLVIMTPMPKEEYEERILEVTTESPKPSGLEIDELTARFIPTTGIPDVATELAAADHLRSDLESATIASDDLDLSTSSDTDATTDTITTETYIPKTERTDSESNLLSIYDTAGPMKLLRKRMFEFKKYVPSTQIKLPAKSSTIKTSSASPNRKYHKRYYQFSTTTPSTKEELSSVKKVTDGIALDTSSNKKMEVERKRYTYKKWFTPAKQNKEEASITSEASEKKSNEMKQRTVDGEEDSTERKQ